MDSDVIPKVEFDWPNPMPTELAEGLATAQAACETVPSLGYNSWHKFHFPKACTIKDEARRIMGLGGLYLAMTKESLDPWPDNLPRGEALAPNPTPVAMLRQTYCLGHTGGQAVMVDVSTPVLSEKGRPMDKAKNAASTSGHKYLCAGLFGMGWDDVTDEPEGRDDTHQGGQRGHKQGKGARKLGREEPKPPAQPGPQTSPEMPSEYDRIYSELRKDAWSAVEFAKRLSIDRDRAFHLATGCEGSMAKGLKPSQLLAVKHLGIALRMIDAAGGSPPRDHSEVLVWYDRNGHECLWRERDPTARGVDFDARMQGARNMPACEDAIEIPSIQVREHGGPPEDEAKWDTRRIEVDVSVERDPIVEPEGLQPLEKGVEFDPKTGECFKSEDDPV